MDEHKFFKATKWVDHDNNEPFYNRPEQRHAMPCHAMPPFSQLHVAVVSTINPLKTPGIPMDATWAMPGIRLGSDPEKKGSNGTKINSAFVGSYAKFVF